MPNATTMGIERKAKGAVHHLGHEVIETRLPTEDPVYTNLLREARELSDTTYVVPLRIDPDDLGGVVNAIRDGVFAHGVVLPVSGPETGHAVPQTGLGEVFGNPNLVVDGSSGEGIGMTINRMHRLERAALQFVPLARDEYRLEAMRNFLELTGQPSVYDRQSERHLTMGEIEGLLTGVTASYKTHFETFWEDVTGKKVNRPKGAKGRGRVGGLIAPPVRIVDEAPGHVAQVPADVEAWYRNIKVDWKKVGLVTAGVLTALSGACAAATPIAPTPIAFVTPTEASPTATTPPTVEAPTATTVPSATPTETAVPPTATPEATATEAKSAEAVVAETIGLSEGDYHFETVNGIRHLLDNEGHLMAIEGWRGEWRNLEAMRQEFVTRSNDMLENDGAIAKHTGSMYEDIKHNRGALGFTAGVSVRYTGSIDLGEKGKVYPRELVPVFVVDETGVLHEIWIGLIYEWNDGNGKWWGFSDTGFLGGGGDRPVAEINSDGSMTNEAYKMIKEQRIYPNYKSGKMFYFLLYTPDAVDAASSSSVSNPHAKEMNSMLRDFLRKVTPGDFEFGSFEELEKMELVFVGELSAIDRGTLIAR